MSPHASTGRAATRVAPPRRPARALAAGALVLCAAVASCARAVPYALTPGAPPARVRFEPPSGFEQPLSVSVTPAGMEQFTCVAPCSMLLPAGLYGARFDTATRTGLFVVTVPSGDSRGAVRMRRNGLYTGGMVLNATGGLLVTVGTSLLTFGAYLVTIVLSSVALALLIPGVSMVAAAGSDGVEFSPAPEGSFARGNAADPRPRAQADLASPAVSFPVWSF